MKLFNFETKTSLVETVSFQDHTEAVTSLCWGKDLKNCCRETSLRSKCQDSRFRVDGSITEALLQVMP